MSPTIINLAHFCNSGSMAFKRRSYRRRFTVRRSRAYTRSGRRYR